MTRSELAQQQAHRYPGPPPPTVIKSVPRPAEMSPPQPVVTSPAPMPPANNQPPPPNAQGSNNSQTPPAAITLPQRILPKIGLILGPGGMKTYAELGIIEAFEKAQIPIHAVIGTEWGALVAASYALHGKAFDAEWKMLKLQRRDLPSPGFLSRELDPGNIAVMHRYLFGIFRDSSIERGTIPFSCPSESVTTGRLLWIRSGSYFSAVEHCLPFPPYFKPNHNWAAAAFDLSDQVAELHRQGINLVIYVNVLDKGSENGKWNPSISLLWLALRNQISRSRGLFDEVINVPTRGYGMTDFAARRNLLRAGVRAGQNAARYLQQKYGM